MISIKTNTPIPSPSTQSCTCGHQQSGFTIDDLELLHHYTTSACLTITQEPLARNFWRVNIPQIAFTTPYILGGILSLSALHLARFRPERKEFYIAQAFHHHNSALTLASPLILNITRENAVQLFLFSTITNFFAFAKPRDKSDLLVSNDDSVPDWLYMFRGVRALMDAESDWIHSSSIAVMFESGVKMHEFWLSATFENEAFRELEANMQASTGHDLATLQVLLEAVRDLKRSFALLWDKSQSDENKSRGIFVWLYKISNAYIDLVTKDNNEALCVLAFFCVLLRRLEFMWWIEGWGLHLIERIYSRLNNTYRLWIRWPIEETGWAPTY